MTLLIYCRGNPFTNVSDLIYLIVFITIASHSIQNVTICQIDNTSRVCIEVTIIQNNSAVGCIVEFEHPINGSIYNYTFYFNNTLTQCLYIPSGFNNTNITLCNIWVQLLLLLMILALSY